jgi:hypothetical protein
MILSALFPHQMDLRSEVTGRNTGYQIFTFGLWSNFQTNSRCSSQSTGRYVTKRVMTVESNGKVYLKFAKNSHLLFIVKRVNSQRQDIVFKTEM